MVNEILMKALKELLAKNTSLTDSVTSCQAAIEDNNAQIKEIQDAIAKLA